MAKRNVTKKAVAKKAVAKKVAAKKAPVKTARKADVITAYAHFPKSGTAYDGVVGDVRSVLICAAMVVAGFAKLNKENIGKGGKGNVALFVGLVGRTPLNYHRGADRIDGNILTAGGVAWFQKRIGDADKRKLTAELIAAMQKGGKAGGLNFNREITAKA
jgi:hypothetical protein